MKKEDNSRRQIVGVVSLLIACLSLLLATVPPYVIDQKIHQLSEIKQPDNALISVEIKGVKLKFWQKKQEEKSFTVSEISRLKNLSKKFTISVYVASVLAIFLGVFSVSKKQTRTIGIGTLAIGCAALTWEYIAAGVTLGVAVIIAVSILISLN